MHEIRCGFFPPTNSFESQSKVDHPLTKKVGQTVAHIAINASSNKKFAISSIINDLVDKIKQFVLRLFQSKQREPEILEPETILRDEQKIVQPVISKPYDSSKTALQFYELTRRIPKEEMLTINPLMDELEGKEEIVGKYFELFKSGNIYGMAWDDKEAIYALFAVKKGLISIETFSTYLNFKVAHNKYHDLQIVRLFLPNGKRNPEAVKIMASNNFRKKETPLMNMKHVDAFFNVMKTKDPLAQVLLLGKPKKTFEKQTISLAVHQNAGVGLFSFYQGYKMIPSFEMMQTSLDVVYESRAQKMNPVLGLSSLKDISSNNIFKMRDMALIFPFVKLPKEADNYRAYGFDFTYHDFYHALVCSNMLIGTQQMANLMFEILSHYQARSMEEEKVLTALKEKLVDQEFATFRRDQSLSKYKDPQGIWEEFFRIWDKIPGSHKYVEILVYLLKELDKASDNCDLFRETQTESLNWFRRIFEIYRCKWARLAFPF